MRQRTTSICIAILSLAGLGCSSDDSNDTGNATTPTTGTTGTSDHGATTHDHGATTDHAATTHDHGGATTHDHGATAADSHGGHDHMIDTDGSDPAVAYCMCVFVNCHEPYHAKWGEDEMIAEQACLAEAGALPSNGAPIETGNFIECRQHFCDLAETDATQCDAALGTTVCM